MTGDGEMPASIDLSGGSFGLQIGVSETDLVLVFTNEDGLKGLFEDKVELGGSVESLRVPSGAPPKQEPI